PPVRPGDPEVRGVVPSTRPPDVAPGNRGRMTGSWARGPIALAGGVVAYNDAPRLEGAVRSLLDQGLPDGVSWSGIWLAISPSSEGPEAVAGRLAGEDPRVHVIAESERRGKSAALAAILSCAGPGPVVLLNGDAAAEPGAIAAMVQRGRAAEPPFAVMA